MPAKRGLCWCIGGSAPPEISYGLENGGMTLKPIEVEIPMPQDEQELNAKFAELVDELGLDKPHREAMFSLPPEKKWQIYCSKKREQDDPTSASWPDYYIERVNAMTHVFFLNDEEEIANRTKLVESLKTALRTQPMSFVLRFIELDGLACLLNFLKNMDYSTALTPIHTSVLGCMKALLNNSQGRTHVLGHPECINVIAQSLATDNIKTKIAVLEILGAICLVPGGHKKVLQSMLHFQKFASERTRFQGLIMDLDRSTGEYRDEVSLKTAIMSFINAALKYGAGQKHLEFRLHLRYEFLMLGIQPIIEKLRGHENSTLDRHLDFFEMVRTEDEKQLAKKFEVSHIDTKSATAMFELLKKKLNYTPGYQHLLSILFHLLQFPIKGEKANQHWHLVDTIVQQICIQTKDGDPDVEPLELDIKKICQQLANENSFKEVQTKLRDVQKENDELLSKFKKKERECEVKIEEKEELMQTLNKIKAKLEKESAAHQEAKAQLIDLQCRLNELQQLVDLERGERQKLEHAVNTGSLPDDAKIGVSTAMIADAAIKRLQSFPTTNSMAPPPPPPPGMPPPPPPPPPPGSGPPGPPPPPGMMPAFGAPIRKKNTPQSSQPLKSFNWSKVPDNQVKGTIWDEVDDAKIYRVLDLNDFEKNFSAYQRQEGSDPDLSNKSVKSKELSVIDGRRAQNCTILLSKLKMTNQELAKAILSCDAQEDLPKDMCEQLLKFIPTVEETQMLGEHEHEIESMAKADRFLFEMSRIDHYEQRLKALYYKKKFSERLNDAKPRVDCVLNASQEILKSRRIRKLLEIVLAFGNYMNRGQRGNAMGFRISSLNKIADTKSSVIRKVNFLHYLLTVIEQKFPDLLRLESELSSVKLAAKVSMSELEADINVLRIGMRDMQTELEFQRKQYDRSYGDKFVSVMSDFMSVATYNLEEVEELVMEAKEKYKEVTKLFCEDGTKQQPDEFFGVFDLFINAYSDAKLDNERFRREKELEAKRVQQEAQMKIEKERRVSKGQINGKAKTAEKGEFDDLISALRTGDVFGDDIAKLKKTRRRVNNGMVKTERSPRERMINLRSS